MKVIDQTPFFNNETGEISFLDRNRALMKFGGEWLKEAEAQKQVIAVLGKVLDRNYTLLRNVTPPGLGASFPFILIGPPGIYVMYATPLTGTFRAKGDQWGTLSGNSFSDEKVNLLTRTERMARAIQVFLRRQGYSELITVEAVLLLPDPSAHVDSVRPIIRVVMRDALERFAISLMQARVALTPESAQDLVTRILKPPKPPSPKPTEMLDEAATGAPPAASTEVPVVPPPPPVQVEIPGITSPALPQSEDPYVPAFALPPSPAPPWIAEPTAAPAADTQPISPLSRRKGLNKRQWAVLIVMFVIWCLLVSVFLYLVLKNQSLIPMGRLP